MLHNLCGADEIIAFFEDRPIIIVKRVLQVDAVAGFDQKPLQGGAGPAAEIQAPAGRCEFCQQRPAQPGKELAIASVQGIVFVQVVDGSFFLRRKMKLPGNENQAAEIAKEVSASLVPPIWAGLLFTAEGAGGLAVRQAHD